jgi:3-dehydroquinate dehydratase/shikimate dehydrogenase
MGDEGLLTRVLGPSRGAFLTYGSTARGKESAAGQPTCAELANLYRVRRLSRETVVTGLLGSPIRHSASPAIHNQTFAALDLDFVYVPFQASEVETFFSRFVRPKTREIDWKLRGFSVTIPHKTAVLPLLDELDSTAREVGAVNTVVIENDKLLGYNTDVRGAMEPLERVCSLEGESCAVIGAGGAARVIVFGLVNRRARVEVFARNVDRARSFASFGVDVLPLEALASSAASIVINTTPVGMRGHGEGASPVPRRALRGRLLAYDLVYNPIETQFLIDARAEGCRTLSGIEMLIAQAALQFELWTGRKPPIDLMREAAARIFDCV